jgi:methylenetetrahydrofolate reductase (NADPH)
MSQSDWPKTFSCEFFPPSTTEGLTKLQVARQQLLAMHPAYFSVTYGAGGSTRDRTVEVVLDIQANSGAPATPHLTCIASTRSSVRELLNHYKAHGIRRIVALRGDMPSGMRDPGEFRYAKELVSFIRSEFGDHFHLEVAAYPEYHPQTPNPDKDLENFQSKVDAGANSAITQYFYNPDAYFQFVDQCARRRIDIPIVPGIMPITNFTQLARFSDACGTEIPRWIRKKLESLGDDRNAIRAFGLDVVSNLCRKLLDGGAPGLHFYTMNQAGLTLTISERLGLLAVN